MDNNEKYPLALKPGTVLNGIYVVEKVLGQGGFGITYCATEYKTGKKVAIKEFFPDTMAYRTATTVASYPGERAESFEYGKSCFLQEAETLAKFIGNDNIVRIYSYFEENGTAYFVMEYIEGTSFDQYIKEKGGKLSFEETKEILLPIMDAMAEVHDNGIVHRDLTPDNIYITNDGKVKLLDFGAARYSLGDKSRSLDVVLKHGFAPKEQYTRRGKQGPFTDVYALGATFYFALTGKRPPDSIDRLEEDELVPPSNLGVKLTYYQEAAILQALNVQPQDRFQNMRVFKKVMLNLDAAEAPTRNTKPVETVAAVPSEVIKVPSAQSDQDMGRTVAASIAPVGSNSDIQPVPPIQQTHVAPVKQTTDTTKKKKTGLIIGFAAFALICILVAVIAAVKTNSDSGTSKRNRDNDDEKVIKASDEDDDWDDNDDTPTPAPTKKEKDDSAEDPVPTLKPTKKPDPTATPVPTEVPFKETVAVQTVIGNHVMNLNAGGEYCCDYNDGGTIYGKFSDYLENTNGEILDDTSGAGFENVCVTSTQILYIQIVGNTRRIRFINKDKSGSGYFTDFTNVGKFILTEDYVFVYDKDTKKLYRMTYSGDIQESMKLDSTDDFTIDNGYLYYLKIVPETNAKGLYKVPCNNFLGEWYSVYNTGGYSYERVTVGLNGIVYAYCDGCILGFDPASIKGKGNPIKSFSIYIGSVMPNGSHYCGMTACGNNYFFTIASSDWSSYMTYYFNIDAMYGKEYSESTNTLQINRLLQEGVNSWVPNVIALDNDCVRIEFSTWGNNIGSYYMIYDANGNNITNT